MYIEKDDVSVVTTTFINFRLFTYFQLMES